VGEQRGLDGIASAFLSGREHGHTRVVRLHRRYHGVVHGAWGMLVLWLLLGIGLLHWVKTAPSSHESPSRWQPPAPDTPVTAAGPDSRCRHATATCTRTWASRYMREVALTFHPIYSLSHIPTVSLGVTCAMAYTYGCGNVRIGQLVAH